MGHTLSAETREAAAGSDQLPSDGLTSSHLNDATNVDTELTGPAGHLDGDKFRPVSGWEGVYEVARDGRIRSVDRIIECADGTTKRLKGVELVVTEGGVSLSREGRHRGYQVSTLVRAVFGAEVPR